MSKIQQPENEQRHIEDPEDACLTAAHKIDAALIFLTGLEDQQDRLTPEFDDGGYGNRMVRDLLQSVRDDLRGSAKAEQDKRAALRNEGGPR